MKNLDQAFFLEKSDLQCSAKAAPLRYWRLKNYMVQKNSHRWVAGCVHFSVGPNRQFINKVKG